MTTIPARLARAAQTSSSPAQARQRVIQLYRDWYRGAPEIVSIYSLNVSPAYFRHCIRRHFEENRYVTDTRVIDVLIQKGRQEYQETMNLWKQTDHIMGILLQPKGRPPEPSCRSSMRAEMRTRYSQHDWSYSGTSDLSLDGSPILEYCTFVASQENMIVQLTLFANNLAHLLMLC
ncbi:NADH-ubiquinone oxidoreductase 14 subunit [Grifola frondosa]|uniref:NADH-ubiquinone oxidoreductase 14 subunit n=1 Tax=Grifola frondosa TaxID=5627 RepID=A0A1C7MDP2_GRIFR|nr:NADH-ubiquinone oxidoreductase 14 subunit [Grifola frondosa]